MKEIEEVLFDIEGTRSKEELKDYIDSRYEIVKKDRKLVELLQLKIGLFKKFREELIPISNYSFSSYAKANAKYKLVLGNQKYDGLEMVDDSIGKIEITIYHNGKDENDMMKSMYDNDGIGHIGGRDFFEARKEYLDGFERNVKNKSGKGYSKTKIIFVIENDIYGILRSDIDEDIDDVIPILLESIRRYDFGDNEVFLMKPGSSIIDISGNEIILVKGQ